MTDPNTPLRPLPAAATVSVVSGIRQASSATKVDFGLLMAEAEQESGFRADATTSDASAYIRSLGFSTSRLDPPIAAMLTLFALGAQHPPALRPATQRRST